MSEDRFFHLDGAYEYRVKGDYYTYPSVGSLKLDYPHASDSRIERRFISEWESLDE